MKRKRLTAQASRTPVSVPLDFTNDLKSDYMKFSFPKDSVFQKRGFTPKPNRAQLSKESLIRKHSPFLNNGLLLKTDTKLP